MTLRNRNKFNGSICIFLYIISLVGRQFLFNTNIKVAGIVVIGAWAGGVVQGRGRIARLCGGRTLTMWGVMRGGRVVTMIVPGVGGRRGVAVVRRLGHPPALIKKVLTSWTSGSWIGRVVRRTS